MVWAGVCACAPSNIISILFHCTCLMTRLLCANTNSRRYDAVRVIALVVMVPPPATPLPPGIPYCASSCGAKQQPTKSVKLLVWDDRHPAAQAAAAAVAAAAAATATAAAATTAAAAAAAARAGQVQPPAAPTKAAAGGAGVPNATSTAAADAAARASARQLLELPSLTAEDRPVCVCPPGPDWDGVVGTLSLSGSINRPPAAAPAAAAAAGNGALSQSFGARQKHQQHQQRQQAVLQSIPTARLSGDSGMDVTSPTVAAATTGPPVLPCSCAAAPVQVQYYASELALLQGFCAVVQTLDPDVITGWDMQQGSLGYLADRGLQLGFNVLRSASKTPEVGGCAAGHGCHATLCSVLCCRHKSCAVCKRMP